jgi:hypothetical protein
MVFDQFDHTLIDATDLIPVHAGCWFQCRRKREIGGPPDSITDVTRGDGEVGKGDVGLLAEVECDYRSCFRIPVELIELVHATEVPAAIADVFEPSQLKGVHVLLCIRENS